MLRDSDDGRWEGPPPRPLPPRRERESIVIQGHAADTSFFPSRSGLFAVALGGALALALAAAGLYFARPSPNAADGQGNAAPRAARADPALAQAARTLARRLEAGQPLGPALADLEKLGVEEPALAPLRPYAATPAPSAAELASALAGLAKRPELGETRPADVAAALRARDLAEARRAFEAWPAPAREAASGWGESLKARLAAERAVGALVDGGR